MLLHDEQRKITTVMTSQRNQSFLHINEKNTDEKFIIEMSQETQVL